jgi:hypothetical protein
MTPERFIEIGTSCLKAAGWPQVQGIRSVARDGSECIGVVGRVPGTTIQCFNGAYAWAISEMTEAEAEWAFTDKMPSPNPRVAVLCRDDQSVRQYHRANHQPDECAFSFHTWPCEHVFSEVRFHDIPESADEMTAILREWTPRLAPGGKIKNASGEPVA